MPSNPKAGKTRGPRLLALDIDHTLTGNDHAITEPNAEAVAWARGLGVRVTVITGRRYSGSAETHAALLGLEGPIGVHYGRRVVEHPSGRVLRNHPLPEGCVESLLRVTGRFPKAYVSVFAGDDLWFEKIPADLESILPIRVFQGNLREIAATRRDEILTLHVSEPSGAEAARAVAEEAARLFPGRLTLYFSPWSGDPNGLLTVISSEADKGTALVEIAAMAGVDPADTVAMGDSVPDIPMLRKAGVGVAMEWSPGEVREAADVVAEGDPTDAVARAIRRLFGPAPGAPGSGP
ncbi:MAG: HAD family phosphatase [Bacillota bacterium]|nr:MAG: HAD family phosphatase [Bacillota bacterium]